MKDLQIQIVALLLFAGTVLSAQNSYTLSGEITDAETGENLIGATVYVAETTLGGSSNSYGFYSLTVPEGEYFARNL